MSQHGRFEHWITCDESTDRQTESPLTIRKQRTIFSKNGQNDTAFRASSFH